ncbi:hypothetical protein OAU50_01775 [Planctomycetota bacterium]|nr:hypothetical protein [Planctomycetota bacterium]
MKNLLIASLLCLMFVPVNAGPAKKEDKKEAQPWASELGLKAFESEHYRLVTDEWPDLAREYLRVLEAEWPLLVAFFGKQPELKDGNRLVVNYLSTQELWQQKLKEDNVAIPFGAGGYYTPQTSAVYFYTQPTVYNTRQLMIHEAMHQFHYLACCNNKNPADNWYIEGIVEHFSRHHWNDQTLQLGAIPLVTLANYPKKALDIFSQEDYSLATMIDSSRQSSRPEQWALVRYLKTAEDGKHLKAWDKLRKKLDAGGTGKDYFRKYLGDPSKLQPKIHKWLEDQQEPFVYLWNEWDPRAVNEVVGWGTVTSGIASRTDIDTISASVTPPTEGDWMGGVLLDYVSNEDYTVGHVRSNGKYSITRMTKSGWRRLRSGSYEKSASGMFTVKAVRDLKGDVEYWINGTLAETIPVNGKRMGLCLEGCRLSFTDLKWE